MNYDFLSSILKSLSMNSYPRTVGNPLQSLVYSDLDIFRFLKHNLTVDLQDKLPAFISHNSYLGAFRRKGVIHTPQIVVEDLFFDLDYSLENNQILENTLEESRELSDRLQDEELNHYFVFTTNKGFQCHIPLKPELHDYGLIPREGENLSESDRLKFLYLGVQMRLVEGLKTIDQQCTGDPKRICRIPYSFYASGEGFVNGRVCIPLERYDLDRDLKELIQMSENPDYKIPREVRNSVSFCDLADKLNALEVVRELEGQYSEKKDFGVVEGEVGTLLYLFERRCPGLGQDLRSKNPHHKTRTNFCLFCKELMDVTVVKMDLLWSELGNKFGYVDSWNRERRIEAIRSIIENPRYRKMGGCYKTKSYMKGGRSLCLGDDCPKFFRC